MGTPSEETLPLVVTLTLQSLEGLPPHSISTGSVISVLWKRSNSQGTTPRSDAHEPHSGEFPQVPYQQGGAEWPKNESASVKMPCPMQRSEGKDTGFKRQTISLRVLCFHPSLPHKAPRTLGKALLHLEEVISPSGQCSTTRQINLSETDHKAGHLRLHIRSTPAFGDERRLNFADKATQRSNHTLAAPGIRLSKLKLSPRRFPAADKPPQLEQLEWKRKEVERQLQRARADKHCNETIMECLSLRNGAGADESSENTQNNNLSLRELEAAIQKLEASKKQKIATIDRLLQDVHDEELRLDRALVTENALKESLRQEETNEAHKDILKKAASMKLTVESLREKSSNLTHDRDTYQSAIQVLQKSSNVTAVFQQRIEILKKVTLNYKAQYERYFHERGQLDEEKTFLTLRLADIEELGYDPGDSPELTPEEYRQRIQFLRRQFLQGKEEYDPITREPICALAIIKFSEENECEEEWITEVLMMIRFMAINAKRDMRRLCYLFSTALCITNYLEGSPFFEYGGDIQGLGIQDEQLDGAQDAEAMSVQQKVNLLNFELYLLFCEQVFPLLDEQLEVSFFSTHALILSKSKKMADPSRLAEGLTLVFDRVLKQLKAASIYPMVIKQIFNQIVFYISVRLANRVLTTRELCTPTAALSIKMGLSFLTSWIQDTSSKEANVLSDCDDQLTIILDVVGVLMTATAEENFRTMEMIEERYPMLNLMQLYTLIDWYAPDDNVPEPIPASVSRSIQQLIRQLPEKEKQQMAITFPHHLNLTKFNADFSDSDQEETPTKEVDYDDCFDLSEDSQFGGESLSISDGDGSVLELSSEDE